MNSKNEVLPIEDRVRRQCNEMLKTTPGFRLDVPKNEIYERLFEIYGYNVARRGQMIHIDDDTRENIDTIASLLTNGEARWGVWLYGTVGNGKTTMLYSICQLIGEIGRKGFPYKDEYFNPNPRFVTARQICEICIERGNNAKPWNDLISRDILCIDDLGTEPREVQHFSKIYEPMTELIEARDYTKPFTFVSSNLAPSQTEEKYRKRVADRCRELFAPVKFLAPTYRGR